MLLQVHWKNSKRAPNGLAARTELSSIVFRRFGDELYAFVGKPVSVVTGEGIGELRRRLDALIRALTVASLPPVQESISSGE